MKWLIFTEKHGVHSKMSWECSLNFKQLYKYSWPITKIKIFNHRNNPNEFLDFSIEDKKNFFLVKYTNLFSLFEKKCKNSKKIHFKLVKSLEIENLENEYKYDYEY